MRLLKILIVGIILIFATISLDFIFFYDPDSILAITNRKYTLDDYKDVEGYYSYSIRYIKGEGIGGETIVPELIKYKIIKEKNKIYAVNGYHDYSKKYIIINYKKEKHKEYYNLEEMSNNDQIIFKTEEGFIYP